MGELISSLFGFTGSLIGCALTLVFLLLGFATLAVLVVSCLPVVLVGGFIFVLFAVFAL